MQTSYTSTDVSALHVNEITVHCSGLTIRCDAQMLHSRRTRMHRREWDVGVEATEKFHTPQSCINYETYTGRGGAPRRATKKKHKKQKKKNETRYTAKLNARGRRFR